jgi:hypothetical protein
MKKRLLLFVILLVVGGLHGFAQKDSTIQKFPILKAELHLNDSLPALLSKTQKPPLWENRYDWISYQMKVSVKTEEEDLAFQCFFVNRTDSLIYLNLHKSGIELARMVLTPDSVIAVNKLQKEYFKGDYRIFRAILGVDLNFWLAQAILTGSDCTDCSGAYSVVAEEGLLRYIWPQRQCSNMALMQELTASEAGIIHKNDLTDLQSGSEVVVTYDNPRLETMNFNPDGDEPRMDTLVIFDGFTLRNESENTQLKATLSKVKVNVPGPTSVKIPDSFTPIIIKIGNKE